VKTSHLVTHYTSKADVFAKKINMLSLDGLRLTLQQFQISHALEKIISDGVDFTGIPGYLSISLTQEDSPLI
jgi:F420-0:gamma-glutamyl ligase-like protein